jgi:V/A-type H+-transporting ATPase subunit G/H
MELIKRIKQAEAEAQEIIERAKAQIARQAEEGRQNRTETLAEAERERKKAIEAAVAAGESEGLAETDNLKAQAEKDRQKLRDKASAKMAGAVAMVMDCLEGA